MLGDKYAINKNMEHCHQLCLWNFCDQWQCTQCEYNFRLYSRKKDSLTVWWSKVLSQGTLQSKVLLLSRFKWWVEDWLLFLRQWNLWNYIHYPASKVLLCFIINTAIILIYASQIMMKEKSLIHFLWTLYMLKILNDF